MRADFQQFYGLNIDDMGTAYSYRHAAYLYVQLPAESRLARKQDPDLEWGVTGAFLSEIEYWLHVLVWQKTEDGRKGTNQPERIPQPSKKEAERRRIENVDKDLVDRVLGV